MGKNGNDSLISILRAAASIILITALCLCMAGCETDYEEEPSDKGRSTSQSEEKQEKPAEGESKKPAGSENEDTAEGESKKPAGREKAAKEDPDDPGNADYVVLDEIPKYSGEPYVEINGNIPEFTRAEIRKAKRRVLKKGKRFMKLSKLDQLGRCGTVVTVVGKETMPEGERGSIGMVKPSGWKISKYDWIDNGGFLYNRCHMLGWQLTGLNDEERNLITGTRYMNTQGMLRFENKVAGYVRWNDKHVLYRVTPIFRKKELVCRGVEIEAYSLEDKGERISINVYCYNVQPGVKINYKNGENRLDKSAKPSS